MDCLKAREIVSEAFDRGIADTPLASEAREHCRSCADCRAFVEGLALLDRMPAPAAPASLVDSIVERGRKMAQAGVQRPFVPKVVEDPPVEPDPADEAATPDETQDAPDAAWEAPATPPKPRRETHDGYWWAPRIAAGVLAAAAAVFAVVLSVQGFTSLNSKNTPLTATSSNSPGAVPQSSAPRAGVSGSADGAATTNGYGTLGSSAPEKAAGSARFVAYQGVAYAWQGDRKPDKKSLNPAGTLSSSLDTSDTPKTYGVWRSGGDSEYIFIQQDPGTDVFTAFRRASRTFAGKTYAMSADGITGFGQWPALPSAYPEPKSADGGPTFRPAGKDDSGLDIFTPEGASPTTGFAIGGGTSVTDPAGGDPKWTWWIPAP